MFSLTSTQTFLHETGRTLEGARGGNNKKMFVYLSKKISIPNGVRIRSIAWNHDQGWIACGGEGGLLKVLKLDHGPGSPKVMGGNNLSMNQSLEGHDKAITVVAWNNNHRKLTSSDENGLIIVWMLHRGLWFEEMINNRNRSVVRDLAWNTEGLKVCIIYEDGAVIVGSVDGNRLWGKELKKTLSHVTWSPEGRYLLFGTLTGEVAVHDSITGQYLTKVPIQCVEDGEYKLAGLQWHAGSPEHCGEQVHGLAICYECGKAQLMRTESDDKPLLIDTGLKVTTMKWNPQGTLLAIGGLPINGNDKVVVLQFYDVKAQHLRTLRIPGTFCGGITWEGNGLRLAVAVDAFIYFAQIRPVYKWTTMSNGTTAVYGFAKAGRTERCVMFWNTKTQEKNIKYVRRLTHIEALGETCAIVSRVDENSMQHVISLNNAIGAPMESRVIDILPSTVAMNENHVIVCSDEMVVVWQHRNPNVTVDVYDPVSIAASRKDTSDRMFHIEDSVTLESPAMMPIRRNATNDVVATVTANATHFVVARESGLLHVYSMNPVVLVARLVLSSRAQVIQLNSNSTMMGVIDLNGSFLLYRLNKEAFSLQAQQADQVSFERKDVWDVRFAADYPDMFVIMEKTRMYVFRGMDPEEPVQTAVNLAVFNQLKVSGIMIDDVMADPEHPAKEAAYEHETKSLRDTRELLKSVGLKDAVSYVEDHPHPVLWSLIAEAALEALDFPVAERAVVRCQEYPAIQFVKRIKSLDDPMKQRAEVLAYYHRFDDAEKVYRDMDRKDLAVELRGRLGDWFRVVQLVQEGGGDESLILNAWDNIGDYYADRQKWAKAVQYYTQAKQYEKLAKVYYAVEDYKSMEKLIDVSGHNKELLTWLGNRFLAIGLAESAVSAFLKSGDVKLAVECCIELHQWDQAVSLAEKHKLPDVDAYLAKYARHLVESDHIPQAIELYRKAQLNNEAAKLLAKLAQQAASKQDPLRAKKFYVLSALEVETFRRRQFKAFEQKSATQVVDELLTADRAATGERALDNSWKGAEAYHLFMLCQQQLYTEQVANALVTAIRLTDYDEIIPATDAYSLIALASYYAKNYTVCSKAFTRLEAMEQRTESEDPSAVVAANLAGAAMSENLVGGGTMTSGTMADIDVGRMSMMGTMTALGRRGGAAAALAGGGSGMGVAALSSFMSEEPRKYADLAIRIFSRHPPSDGRDISGLVNTTLPWCVASGKTIPNNAYWECSACRHKAIPAEVDKYKNCPLCHSPR